MLNSAVVQGLCPAGTTDTLEKTECPHFTKIKEETEQKHKMFLKFLNVLCVGQTSYAKRS